MHFNWLLGSGMGMAKTEDNEALDDEPEEKPGGATLMSGVR